MTTCSWPSSPRCCVSRDPFDPGAPGYDRELGYVPCRDENCRRGDELHAQHDVAAREPRRRRCACGRVLVRGYDVRNGKPLKLVRCNTCRELERLRARLRRRDPVPSLVNYKSRCRRCSSPTHMTKTCPNPGVLCQTRSK